jgi:hypothetical protein
LREPGQVVEIAGVIAVDQVDRQPESDDRMQRGRSDQVAAVQDRAGAERFRFCDRRGQGFTVVVAVGDDANFQSGPLGLQGIVPDGAARFFMTALTFFRSWRGVCA